MVMCVGGCVCLCVPVMNWFSSQGVFLPCTESFQHRLHIHYDTDQDKEITEEEEETKECMNEWMFSFIPT